MGEALDNLMRRKDSGMDWLQAIRLYSTERRDEVLAEDPDFVFPEDSLDAKPTAATLAAVAEFRRSRRWRRNG